MTRRIMAFALLFSIFMLSWITPAAADGGGGLRIACIMRGGSTYWDNVARGINDEAAAHGDSVLYLYIAGVENALSWESAARIALLSGCRVILTSYSSDEGYLDCIREARESGCGVVFMDNDGPEELRDCYVGVDTLAAGRAMAENMLRYLSPGDVALLCTSPVFAGNQNQALLRQGIEEVFAASECRLDYFSDSLNLDERKQTELDEYLTAHTEVRGVFSMSQLQTRGYVSLSTGSSWGSRVHIIGIDYQEVVRPAIESGLLTLLDKSSYELGAASCRVARVLASGGAPESCRIHVPFTILDEGSIGRYLEEVK